MVEAEPTGPAGAAGGMIGSMLVGGDLGMKYSVALVQTDEGYSVSCPGLPGCWSQGATEDEALENIRAAIEEYVAAARELAGEQELREVEVKG